MSYGHKIAALAATPKSHAMGGQFTVVREASGLKPGGTPILHFSLSEEMKDFKLTVNLFKT